MKRKIFLIYIFLGLMACNPPETTQNENFSNDTNLSPDQRYGELFHAIQMKRIFPDGKTFADCTPKSTPAKILANYQAQKSKTNFDLKEFVLANFDLPKQYASDFKSDTSLSASEHINQLWTVLTREPEKPRKGSTLLALPNPYIVPGGRFGEIYYWDSYFTMLGLQAANKAEMIENVLDNFAYLIDNQGFIPNGNRTYFLGRSQPPFFALMVGILAEMNGEKVYLKYLPQLEKEHNFWQEGAKKLKNQGDVHRRVVKLSDDIILNRYWDDFDTPRPESYREDVETAKLVQKPVNQTYRHLRAGAESGWDFCSRWFTDKRNLKTIHTTDIIPVDLNSLLYNLETTLTRAYAQKGEKTKALDYQQLADKRKYAILKYCWNEKAGFFNDYDFVKKDFTQVPSLAGLYPLCFKIANANQVEKIAERVEKEFLKAGGLISTLHHTGEQWDAPNGWAPLQWMSIWGLRNYQKTKLANEIKKRWVNLNVRVYKKTGKLVEKYNVEASDLEGGGGGEYPLQDGFGWTNGVLLKLLSEK